MTIVLTRDPHEFAARAGEFIAGRVECNMLGTVLANVLDGFHVGAENLFAYVCDDADQVRAAALRTPPWRLLTSELEAREAGELIRAWLHQDPQVDGVTAPPCTARAICAAWAAQTGGSTECRIREAMHELEQVRDPPRPARGRLRLADESELDRLVDWMQAFVQEAGLVAGDQARAIVEMRIAHQRMLVWDDDGPVSMVGTGPRSPGVVRIGPVYTPPQHRRQGYAGSAVAVTSRRALKHGARRCVLFTDLANPTSNKIYAEVGYRRFADWEEHAFSLG